jgi:hypothetical protein
LKSALSISCIFKDVWNFAIYQKYGDCLVRRKDRRKNRKKERKQKHKENNKRREKIKRI